MSATEPKAWVECPKCGGDNYEYRHAKCDACDGSGTIPATLLPLADGQMCVVDKGAWEKAHQPIPPAIIRFFSGTPGDPDDPPGMSIDMDKLVPHILTALFGKDGIQVAEAVGVLEDFADHGHPAEMQMRTADNRCLELGDYEGRAVALLAEDGKESGSLPMGAKCPNNLQDDAKSKDSQ